MSRTARFAPAHRRASGGPRLRLDGLFLNIPTRFWVFAAFIAFVFLTGGGSREDIASLVILRPAAAFFAAYALTVAVPGDLARVRVPLFLLIALALWMAIQLIPLPTGLWSALPGRADILATDRLIGLGDIWRPISLSPSKTVNSLASLIVPAAALLLYAVQAEADRRRLFGLFLMIAAASAVLGIAQIASGGQGPLYLYATTNFGDAVGLFSNRNHNAVFIGSVLLIGAYLLAELRRLTRSSEKSVAPALIGGVFALVLVTLLINGSRAGLMIGMLAVGFGVALYIWLRLMEPKDGHVRPIRLWTGYLPIIGIVLLAVLAGAALFSQSSSFDRLVTLSLGEELRVQTLPQIAAMANDHWLFGTGFGSFEHIYRSYEASEWLRSEYVNNAHDDWLQWIIEGGLPAMLILFGFVVWLAARCLAHWKSRQEQPARTGMVLTAAGVLGLLLVASLFDYPLRVPSMMVYAMLMVALIADPPQPRVKLSRKESSRDRGQTR
ncbi:O-antigen ligase family protein [Sphingomonas sp. AOB5]|uniref:O-antigen ligase family protein n=1 Tax=Sphingomonas sp. AOB5 TaxID=3034017 RepID=UPI0023FA42E6|nr:O-antigen ligase family protein [Sphingomonas sp. AOB5]MDF7775436.1 O-antigen ligase family protein [Sphingomonas sp. AOB5]